MSTQIHKIVIDAATGDAGFRLETIVGLVEKIQSVSQKKIMIEFMKAGTAEEIGTVKEKFVELLAKQGMSKDIAEKTVVAFQKYKQETYNLPKMGEIFPPDIMGRFMQSLQGVSGLFPQMAVHIGGSEQAMKGLLGIMDQVVSRLKTGVGKQFVSDADKEAMKQLVLEGQKLRDIMMQARPGETILGKGGLTAGTSYANIEKIIDVTNKASKRIKDMRVNTEEYKKTLKTGDVSALRKYLGLKELSSALGSLGKVHMALRNMYSSLPEEQAQRLYSAFQRLNAFKFKQAVSSSNELSKAFEDSGFHIAMMNKGLSGAGAVLNQISEASKHVQKPLQETAKSIRESYRRTFNEIKIQQATMGADYVKIMGTMGDHTNNWRQAVKKAVVEGKALLALGRTRADVKGIVGTQAIRATETYTKKMVELRNQYKTNRAALVNFIRSVRSGRSEFSKTSQEYIRAKDSLIVYNQSIKDTGRSIDRAVNAQKRMRRGLERAKAAGEGTFLGLNSGVKDFSFFMDIAISKIIRYRIAFGAFRMFMDFFRSSLTIPKEIAYSFAQVAKVITDVTASVRELQAYGIGMAASFGVKIKDVANIMFTWAQQGKTQNEILALTKTTLIGMTAANLTSTQAVEALTSAIKQFNIDAEDSGLIMDKLLNVQRNFAITSQDLADSFKVLGATAQNMGMDINSLFGTVTAVAEVTRKSGKAVANSLKTVFSRIVKREAVAAINSIGVAMYDLNGDLRTMDSILDDLALAWQDLNKAERLHLAQTVGGIRRYNDFIVLMDHYGTKLHATAVSSQSLGAAQRAADIELNTLQRSLQMMTQQWSAFVQQVGDSVVGFATLARGLNALGKVFVDNEGHITWFAKAMGGIVGTLMTFGTTLIAIKGAAYVYHKAISRITDAAYASVRANMKMVAVGKVFSKQQWEEIIATKMSLAERQKLYAQLELTGRAKIKYAGQTLIVKKSTIDATRAVVAETAALQADTVAIRENAIAKVSHAAGSAGFVKMIGGGIAALMSWKVALAMVSMIGLAHLFSRLNQVQKAEKDQLKLNRQQIKENKNLYKSYKINVDILKRQVGALFDLRNALYGASSGGDEFSSLLDNFNDKLSVVGSSVEALVGIKIGPVATREDVDLLDEVDQRIASIFNTIAQGEEKAKRLRENTNEAMKAMIPILRQQYQIDILRADAYQNLSNRMIPIQKAISDLFREALPEASKLDIANVLDALYVLRESSIEAEKYITQIKDEEIKKRMEFIRREYDVVSTEGDKTIRKIAAVDAEAGRIVAIEIRDAFRTSMDATTVDFRRFSGTLRLAAKQAAPTAPEGLEIYAAYQEVLERLQHQVSANVIVENALASRARETAEAVGTGADRLNEYNKELSDYINMSGLRVYSEEEVKKAIGGTVSANVRASNSLKELLEDINKVFILQQSMIGITGRTESIFVIERAAIKKHLDQMKQANNAAKAKFKTMSDIEEIERQLNEVGSISNRIVGDRIRKELVIANLKQDELILEERRISLGKKILPSDKPKTIKDRLNANREYVLLLEEAVNKSTLKARMDQLMLASDEERVRLAKELAQSLSKNEKFTGLSVDQIEKLLLGERSIAQLVDARDDQMREILKKQEQSLILETKNGLEMTRTINESEILFNRYFENLTKVHQDELRFYKEALQTTKKMGTGHLEEVEMIEKKIAAEKKHIEIIDYLRQAILSRLKADANAEEVAKALTKHGSDYLAILREVAPHLNIHEDLAQGILDLLISEVEAKYESLELEKSTLAEKYKILKLAENYDNFFGKIIDKHKLQLQYYKSAKSMVSSLGKQYLAQQASVEATMLEEQRHLAVVNQLKQRFGAYAKSAEDHKKIMKEINAHGTDYLAIIKKLGDARIIDAEILELIQAKFKDYLNDQDEATKKAKELLYLKYRMLAADYAINEANKQRRQFISNYYSELSRLHSAAGADEETILRIRLDGIRAQKQAASEARRQVLNNLRGTDAVGNQQRELNVEMQRYNSLLEDMDAEEAFAKTAIQMVDVIKKLKIASKTVEDFSSLLGDVLPNATKLFVDRLHEADSVHDDITKKQWEMKDLQIAIGKATDVGKAAELRWEYNKAAAELGDLKEKLGELESPLEALRQAGADFAESLSEVVLEIRHDELKEGLAKVLKSSSYGQTLANTLSGGITNAVILSAPQYHAAILDSSMSGAAKMYYAIIRASEIASSNIENVLSGIKIDGDGGTTLEGKTAADTQKNVITYEDSVREFSGAVKDFVFGANAYGTHFGALAGVVPDYVKMLSGADREQLDLSEFIQYGRERGKQQDKDSKALSKSIEVLGTQLTSMFAVSIFGRGGAGQARGASIGATFGSAAMMQFTKTTLGAFAGPIGAIAGGLIGSLFGGRRKALKPLPPAPEILKVTDDNTDALLEASDELKKLTVSMNDVRNQLINAPSSFTLPSQRQGGIMAGGGGLVLNISVAGSMDKSAADRLASNVNDIYNNQYRRQGYVSRLT